MALDPKKPKSVERIIYKVRDVVADSIVPTSEEIEECLKRLNAVESRITDSATITEDRRQDALEAIGNLRKFFSERKSGE